MTDQGSADRRRMLEVHITFELDRWTDDGLEAAIAEEVDAWLGGLGGVRVEALALPDDVRAAVLRAVATPLPADVESLVAEAISAGREAMAGEQVRLDDVLEDEDWEAAVETVVGLRRMRHEVIDQITTSTVYSELVAHVLYHGIKDYLVTQNVLARRIPGASSMLRLGQNAVSAAAPGLERGVDRQLTAFVIKNVADTVRGSGAFLARMLDDDMIRAVGAEIRAANADRTASDAADLVPEASVVDVVDVAARWWEALQQTDALTRVVTAAVDGFYADHGDRPVADLLADLGITSSVATREITAVVLPVVRAARASGLLEGRIRARLEEFYLRRMP